MMYAVLTFPRPRTLKLVELTDNRFGADMAYSFAHRPAALVRLGEPPAVLKVIGVDGYALAREPTFWAAVEAAIRAREQQRRQLPSLDRPHRKRQPWH
jgi:hypothetical protein